jgi:hypothetical protein
VIRGTLDAQAVDINTVLVKYTYTGDADLTATSMPTTTPASSRSPTHATGHRNGDLNFSGGSPNSDDYSRSIAPSAARARATMQQHPRLRRHSRRRR